MLDLPNLLLNNSSKVGTVSAVHCSHAVVRVLETLGLPKRVAVGNVKL